jgi:hypothetical protein
LKNLHVVLDPNADLVTFGYYTFNYDLVALGCNGSPFTATSSLVVGIQTAVCEVGRVTTLSIPEYFITQRIEAGQGGEPAGHRVRLHGRHPQHHGHPGRLHGIA